MIFGNIWQTLKEILAALQTPVAPSGGATEAKQDTIITALQDLTWSTLAEVDLSSTDATWAGPYPTGLHVAIPGNLTITCTGLTDKTIPVGVGPIRLPGLSKVTRATTTAGISCAGFK